MGLIPDGSAVAVVLEIAEYQYIGFPALSKPPCRVSHLVSKAHKHDPEEPREDNSSIFYTSHT